MCRTPVSGPEARVGPIRLEGPAVLASGILGTSTDLFARLREAGAGAVVTKSLSREPREGYPNPTVVGLGGGGWLNAVGLSNPGARVFADSMGAGEGPGRAPPIMVSLVGSAVREFVEMVGMFEGRAVAAYELNMSCPHVEKVGLEVGDDPDLVARIVGATKRAAPSTPVAVKVGLGSSDYLDTVRSAAGAGADAITAINTVRAMAISAELQRPILSNRFGGLSGTPIKPIATRCVYEIASEFGGEMPIMGCGGVSGWEDAVQLILAGASAVQVGSALGADDLGVFGRINAGISAYMERKGIRRLEDMVGLARV